MPRPIIIFATSHSIPLVPFGAYRRACRWLGSQFRYVYLPRCLLFLSSHSTSSITFTLFLQIDLRTAIENTLQTISSRCAAHWPQEKYARRCVLLEMRKISTELAASARAFIDINAFYQRQQCRYADTA